MPEAYSYVRFSSDRQELGDSLRRQVALAEDYAARHNLTLSKKSYRDLGISAFKGRNAAEGALGTFLQAVDAGLIPKGSYLLVESMDRLSRQQVDDALELFLSITRRGIVIVTVSDGQVYSKETIKENWTKLIVALAIMSRANEESATKSKRAREVVQTRISSNIPLGHSMPPWVYVNEAKTGYGVHNHKADIVKRIFEMSLKGNGLYLITKTLNEEKVPVLRNARDGWSISGVKQLMNNPNVIGTLRSKHGDFEDHYPAIIEKSVFYEVQRLMSERNKAGNGKAGSGGGRKGANVANLFSNLVKCGECGGSMKFTRSPTGDGGRVNEHLMCLSSLEKRGCDAKRLNYEFIEKALLKEFLEYDAIEVEPRSVSDADPTVALKAEIADKQSQVDKLLDLIEASGTRESKNLLGRLSVREAELAELQEKLRVAEVPSPASDVWTAALEMMKRHEELKATPGPELFALRLQLQAAIKQFVERIDLPMKIVIDKKNKVLGHVQYRQALVLYRGRQKLLLIKRNLERDGKVRKLITEEVLAYHEAHREPVSVLYRVPTIGGGKPGRKGKKIQTSA